MNFELHLLDDLLISALKKKKCRNLREFNEFYF